MWADPSNPAHNLFTSLVWSIGTRRASSFLLWATITRPGSPTDTVPSLDSSPNGLYMEHYRLSE